MSKKLHIKFVPCIKFDIIGKLANRLSVFDDSCEELYQEKDFDKIAVAGGHGKIGCIFVKHNLFHQSKWSRTIDLNTTHIVIFNSPRDEQQVEHFGGQLEKVEFIRDSYQKATTEPYGHFMIDLDPKTSDSLRFCSIFVGIGPAIFLSGLIWLKKRR